MTLALSPIGPAAPGLQYRLVSTNDGEVVVEVIDAGAAGTTLPLSNVLFTDGGTVVPIGAQNGSQATPNHLMATSLAALPVNGVVVATPGDYSAEGVLTIAQNASVLSYQPEESVVTLQQVSINANKVFQASGLQLTANLVLNAGSVFVGNQFQCLNILGAVGSVNLGNNSVIIGTISCSGIVAQETTFGNDITIASNGSVFIECNFPSGGHAITFTAAGPNFLTLDATSFRSFVSAGMTLNNATIISNDFLPPAATTATLATAAYANVPNGVSVFVVSDGFTYKSVPVGKGQAVGTGNDWRRDMYFGDLPDSNVTSTSSIQQAWTIRSSAADNIWNGIAFGNGVFVSVARTGVGNRVMTSLDGINWVTQVSAADNSWNAVTFGNGIFVAVSSDGANRVMTSPDGVTWTARAGAVANSWFAVTYGKGLFVAVSIDGVGNRVMTSPDGITWTSRVSAQDNQWLRVAFGNGLFVAVSFDGANRVMTSPDGFTWTARAAAAANQWQAVGFGNGLFVAVSGSGVGNRVMTSPDGITWTSRVSAADNTWNDVKFANGLWVAVSGSGVGNRVMTSPDGITWTSAKSAADNNWSGLTFGLGLFVAVAFTSVGNRVMTCQLSPASGNVAQGTVVLNGAVAVNVANTAITANNFVVLTLSVQAGTPGTAPSVIITAGTGFSVTGIALDTSTYFWRII